ncbi:O-antigen ligase [Quadrisphaera granulorum]|uniref:O-antigen ligase n=1 Tax=Quadrisphaera granulorum TaxID=317664 RepID=A0A315ZVI7_9ACTN|nr:O-antigen ligase family protein [Quadrisphaera granulorum]PWJ48644.1 O-antigen ligase [Quadrisphaera granulorum]SZE98366.1 O-antigen ligase [Quadrisphaera granulorum]
MARRTDDGGAAVSGQLRSAPALATARKVVLLAGIGGVAVLLCAALVVLVPGSPIAGSVLLVAALCGGVALFSVPVHWLPGIALVTFVVIPMQLLPSQGAGNVLRPALVILYVWLLRRLLATPLRALADPANPADPHPIRSAFGWYLMTSVSAVLLAVWTWTAIGWSPIPTTSTSWTASFLLSAFLPLLVLDAREEARVLRSCFLWAGAAAGAYAMLEQAVRSSPLFDAVYAALGAAVGAPWAVYRAEVSFGHPLFAGAFLTVPAVLGIVGWLQGGRRRELVLGAIAAVGVVMTVSRGSLLAVGAGLVAGAAALALVMPGVRKERLLAVVPFGIIAVLGLGAFGPLSQREDSVESGLSADVRFRALDVALRSAEQTGWLGGGPATSGVLGRQFSQIVIENSILQLLMSLGVPGLLLFVLVVGSACIVALQRGDAAAAAVVVAYVVAIAGFNALDAVRGMHVMMGFLLLLALHGRRLDTVIPPQRLRQQQRRDPNQQRPAAVSALRHGPVGAEATP